MKNRSEVRALILTEYDEKKHIHQVREEGIEEGFEKGTEAAESRNNALTSRLITANRIDDLKKATTDPDYKEALYKEFKL